MNLLKLNDLFKLSVFGDCSVCFEQSVIYYVSQKNVLVYIENDSYYPDRVFSLCSIINYVYYAYVS